MNFVYDALPVPGAKTDNPEQVIREASIPSDQKTTAAEVNELSDAATGLRTAVNELTPFFNIMRYADGVPIGDGVTDATDALEAALAAAGAAAQTVSGLAISTPEVVIPAGGFIQSRPLFLPGGVSVRGAGPGATVLAWKAFTWGPSFLAADADDGVNSVHLSGGTLLCDYDNADAKTHSFTDLSQYTYGRLPAGSWTIRFARSFSQVLTDAAQGAPLLYIGAAAPWTGSPTVNPAVHVFLDPFAVDGSLRLTYRFNNVLTTVTAPFIATPVLANGTWYEFELDYDDSAGTLRFFCNGELWTRGALALAGADDSSKLRQHIWERITIGSAVGGYYPSESILFATAKGAMRGFHLSDGVRHTSGYTPTPTVDPVSTVNTLLLVNFSETFNGCLVGSGINGNYKVYLRPVRGVITEHPRIQLSGLTTLAGSGIRLEFTSEGQFNDLIVDYASSGLELARNCYFTHLTHIRVLHGGRSGIVNEGGAYNEFQALGVSAPVGIALTSANVSMAGCSSTPLVPAVAGLVVVGGTGNILGWSIDSEANAGSSPWQAALVVQDTNPYNFVGCTIYNPPDRLTSSPILVNNSVSPPNPSGYNFLGCWPVFVPSNVALVRLIGSGTTLPTKIVMAGPVNTSASPLCSVGGQARDPWSPPRGNFQVSAAATTHQVDLPSAGFGTAYEVSVTPVDASAGASAGSTRVRKVAKSDDHFIVTVEAAPGGSETANFDYVVEI